MSRESDYFYTKLSTMKKILLLSVLLSILILPTQAQFEPDQIKYSKAVFIELGGNGLLFSTNYEMRFKKGVQDGLGFRAGVGGISVTDDIRNRVSVLTFPLAINNIIGKRRSAFETGVGITPVIASAQGTSFANDFKTTGIIGFINIGYRFQPIKNGFLFKINWTPVISGGGFEPRWFGISLGYGFK